MSSFLQKKKPKEETAIVFVIESGKIISAIISIDTEKPVDFLFSHKESIGFQQNMNVERLESLMLSSLKRSAEKLSRDGFISARGKMKHKHKIYVFLGSPWYVSTLDTASISKKESFLVEKGFLEKFSRENIKIKDENLSIIDQKIVSVKTNGYISSDPVGKKVKTLSVDYFITESPKKIIADIEEILHLSFPFCQITYHTAPSALFPVTKELIKKENFILIIPEHEVSEMILVRNGAIQASVSIPYGKNMPVRALANTLGKEKNDSISLIKLLISKSLEQSKENKVEKALENSRKLFQDLLRDSIWELSPTVILPKDIVVADDSFISKLIGKWIAEEDWGSNTYSNGSFDIHFLTNKDLEKNIKAEKDIWYLNPLLASIGLYIKSS